MPATIEKVLDEIEDLNLDEQEFLEGELHKRIAERNRFEIFNSSKKIKDEISQKDYKRGSVDDFLKDINS